MRVLLAIGCNDYHNGESLSGAEVDAERIFHSLIRPDIGDYNKDRSILMRSPTLEQVREAIASILFSETPLEVFTFYFAGHGSVKAGSFYMWLKDTAPNSLSVSGLALGQLLKNLSEAAPRQSNIIIDACESGGLIEDLGAILKPSLIGDVGSPAITLFATSAQNESAGETESGGFGTTAILDCVEGREFVQDTSPALELIEIGRRVAARIIAATEGHQHPVIWGLNLYGPPAFSKNPRFASDPTLPLRSVMQSWSADIDRLVRRHSRPLWKCYAEIGGDWNKTQFSDLIRLLLQSANDEEGVVGQLAERLCTTFLQGASESEDLFRKIEVVATIAVALLPVSHTVEGKASAERILETLYNELFYVISRLLENLRRNRYALLPRRGSSLGELFDLPVRVAKIIAWSSVLPRLAHAIREAEAVDLYSIVIQQILLHYAGSIVAVSDEQAPCWAITLHTLYKFRLIEEGEQILGLAFNSLVKHEGHIARTHLPIESVFEFLEARAKGNYKDCYELLERPAETPTVLLRASSLYDLEEVFDRSLWKLDGTAMLAFVPETYENFGDSVIAKGQNLLWSIGHDIFRTKDLILHWPCAITAPSSELTVRLCILSALLYPDRVPWFLFGDATSESELRANLSDINDIS